MMDKSDYEKASKHWQIREDQSVKMKRSALLLEMEKFIQSHNTCALATGFDRFVRCTPIEYSYKKNAFWLFSEGGLKFKALSENNNVCLAIYDPYRGFGSLAGMQVTGKAEIIEMWSEEYLNMLSFKKIPSQALKRMEAQLYLIKIIPTRIDYLCSEFKKQGFDSRQYIEFSK